MREKPIYRMVKAVNGRLGIKFNDVLDYDFMSRQITRDNQRSYNARSGCSTNSIRIPSLRRNDRVWRNFYHLFPWLIGEKVYRGCKLKQIKIK